MNDDGIPADIAENAMNISRLLMLHPDTAVIERLIIGEALLAERKRCAGILQVLIVCNAFSISLHGKPRWHIEARRLSAS